MSNRFSMEEYASIIDATLDAGYRFVTLREFVQHGMPETKFAVLRHDVDVKPRALMNFIDVERERGVRSTSFVRVTANEYNVCSYDNVRMMRTLVKEGFEIGLHTNCAEHASITDGDPLSTLFAEINLLKNLGIDIHGIAPHRDINYIINTLPWLEQNWKTVIENTHVEYHAYENRIIDAMTYVNEGFNPHICWRDVTPFDVISTGKSIYILTHPHWWFKVHPFEGL